MVLYKEFEIGKLFKISRGNIKNQRNLKVSNKEDGVSFIAQKDSNNGFVKTVLPEDYKVFEGNNIIVGRQTGAVYYQEEEFVTTDGVLVMRSNHRKLNKYKGLYIATMLTKQMVIYGYTNTVSAKKLKELIIELPVKSLEDNEPDWEYMEDYIKQKELAHIGKLNLEFEQKKEQLIELIGEESEYINIEEIPTAKFKVGDLFNITPTNYYRGLADGDIMKEGGTTPLITTTETDNGIRGYSHLEPNNEGNTITASDTTTSEAVFYQKDPYIGRSHVQRWDAKYDINKEISLYIISSVRKSARGIYDYGNKFNRERMNNTEIELPINPEVSELVPDWETMEDYINGIKHLYKHKEEESHKEKLELLYELTGWTEQDLDNIENRGGAIIKALIDWNAMEKYMARVELQLLNRVINTLNK